MQQVNGFPGRFVRRLGWGLTFCVGACFSFSAAVAQAAPRVAVAEITFEPGKQHSGGTDANWALGVRSMLEYALSQRGVTLVERERIGSLLGETRLQVGLAGHGQAPGGGPAGPSADLVVTGVIRQAGPRRFALALRLVQSSDGAVLGQVSESGGFPTQLAERLESAADKLRSLLGEAVQFEADLTSQPGFTDSPEAALMFFRAVDHLEAGRYNWAASYFDEAGDWDRDFLIAHAWLVRAIERMGLGFMADAEAADLAKRWAKAEALQADRREAGLPAAESPDLATHRAIVTGIADLPEGLTKSLISSVGAGEYLQLVTSASLRAAIAEHELHLEREYAYLAEPGDQFGWLSATAVLRVGSRQGSGRPVDLVDLRSGKPIARGRLVEGLPLTLRWLESQEDDAGSARSSRAKGGHRPTLGRPTVSNDREALATENRVTRESGASVWAISGSALWRRAIYWARLAEHPNDLTLLVTADYTMGLARREAATDRAVALIRKYPDTPDAAKFLSWLGWVRYEGRFHAGHDNLAAYFASEVPIAERYRELLELYPDSDAAALTKYALADEAYEAGEYARAIRLLEQARDRWEQVEIPGPTNRHGRASLNCFLALACYAAGRPDQARAAVDLAMETMETPRSTAKYQGEYPLFRSSRTNKWTAYGRHKRVHRQYYDELLELRGKLHVEADCLQAAIDMWQRTGRKADDGPFMSDHDWFLRGMNTVGDESVLAHLRSLEMLVEYKGRQTEKVSLVSERVLYQFALLRQRVRKPAHRKRYLAACEALKGKGTSSLTRKVDLMNGGLDQVRDYLDRRLAREVESMDRRREREQTQPRNPDLLIPSPWPVIDNLQTLISVNSLHLPRDAQIKAIDKWAARCDIHFQEDSGELPPIACAYHETVARAYRLLGCFSQAEARYRKLAGASGMPRIYQLRAERLWADCLMRQGRPQEASKRLREIVDELAEMPHSRFSLDGVKGSDYWADQLIRNLDGLAPGQLRNLCRASLERLRLIGGYEDLAGREPYDAGQTLSAEDAGMLAATIRLCEYPDWHDRWKGRPRLLNAARTGMEMMPLEQAAAVYAQMPMVLWRDEGEVFTTKRGWLGLANQRFRQAGREASAEQMSWLMHHGESCEYHRYALLTAQWSQERVDTIPSMVLVTGKRCTSCSNSATRALEQMPVPEPRQESALRRLMQHPSARVSAEAAVQMARLRGLPLPIDGAGRPRKDAVDLVTAAMRSPATTPAAPGAQPGVHREPIIDSSYSSASAHLATLDASGRVIARDLEADRVVADFAVEGQAYGIVFDAPGERLLVETLNPHANSIACWQVSPTKKLWSRAFRKWTDPVGDASEIGRWVAVSGTALQELDGETGADGPQHIVPFEFWSSVLSEAGERAIVYSPEGAVWRYDMETGAPTELGRIRDVNTAASSLGKHRYVLGLRGGDLHIYDTQHPGKVISRYGAVRPDAPDQLLGIDESKLLIATDRKGRLFAFSSEDLTPRWRRVLPDMAAVDRLSTMPDGKTFWALTRRGTWYHLDRATGETLATRQYVQRYVMTPEPPQNPPGAVE